MMMCKQAEQGVPLQAEQGVPLQAEQADWLADTDEEIDEQELEAHYIGLWGRLLVVRNCLIVLQNKQNELEKYIAFNDRAIDYEILQTKLNDTLGLLSLKDIKIKEGLKTKACEILVLNQKHDELVKKSLLTKSQLEGYLKEKTKVISDLKVKEEKDIDKMIEMDKQLKFLNEIIYTRNQSIQTIHMLAPKCSTYNGRPTFANPRYLKKAQSEKPCLYEIPYDNSDHANRFTPEREETTTLENESRSKLNKDKVKPYDYTNQNSLYENFKAPSLEYLYQLERAKEVSRNNVGENRFSNSRTSNENVVCAECGTCVFNSNHDACVSRYLKDVNARTKKPNVVPISASKPKRKANKFMFAPILGYRDLIQGNVKIKRRSSGKRLLTMEDVGSISPQYLFKKQTSSTPICLMAKAYHQLKHALWHRRLSHLNFDYITLLSKKEVVNGLPKLKYVKDQLCSSCEMSKAKRSSFKTKGSS
ncbi:retrovirus-related pol polyprotein from transposon TNT 1-94 [Tanacetum coccineum]|uniref:Retrovirus-related pol polyprotein from transposon TNT 1-94 n=1 Tax=Tanacetum coccineum TaxID=301880 RepID=A0ABQ5D7V9_9ASTR